MSLSASVAFVALVGIACPSASGTPAVRDNYVDFQGAESIGWTETLHSISDGQPYDGVSTFGTSIRIKAGRQGGPQPAADFFEGLSFDEHVMGLEASKAKKPEDLNFATFGTLTFKFPSGDTRTCDGVRIGQGHAAAKNNWWIASENCMQTKQDGFVCESCGLSFSPGGDHTFKVREIDVDTGIDNKLEFQGANAIDWKETSHSILNGQPYEGVAVQGSTMDILAGREASPGAANDFFDGLSEVNVMAVGDGDGAESHGLNFATFGTFVAKFPFGRTRACEDLRVGQSGVGAHKTWWIAGKDCQKVSSRLACEACGVAFAMGEGGQEVEVSLMSEPAALV